MTDKTKQFLGHIFIWFFVSILILFIIGVFIAGITESNRQNRVRRACFDKGGIVLRESVKGVNSYVCREIGDIIPWEKVNE